MSRPRASLAHPARLSRIRAEVLVHVRRGVEGEGRIGEALGLSAIGDVIAAVTSLRLAGYLDGWRCTPSGETALTRWYSSDVRRHAAPADVPLTPDCAREIDADVLQGLRDLSPGASRDELAEWLGRSTRQVGDALGRLRRAGQAIGGPREYRTSAQARRWIWRAT